MALGDRGRHALLIGRQTIAAIVIGAALPFVVVRLSWWMLERLPIGSPELHILTGALLLIIGAHFVLVARRTPHPSSPLKVGPALSALAGFIALAIVARIPALAVVAPLGLVTLAAAGAEEIVFRRWLPDRLSETLGSGVAASTVVLLLSQLAFSLVHATNPSFVAARPMEFVALFAAGILYRGIASYGGIAMAAAVHGALNLSTRRAG